MSKGEECIPLRRKSLLLYMKMAGMHRLTTQDVAKALSGYRVREDGYSENWRTRAKLQEGLSVQREKCGGSKDPENCTALITQAI